MNDGRRVLPCPFCGGPAKMHKQLDGFRKVRGYYVCCNTRGCPVFASTRVKKEKGAVIDEWNTRRKPKCENCIYLEADGEIINEHIDKHIANDQQIKALAAKLHTAQKLLNAAAEES